MLFSLKETQLGLRNSITRIPFRYGSACLTRCPQAVLAATIDVDGRLQTGFSGDCLPPSWFDKNPKRDYAGQIDDMLSAIAIGEAAFLDAARAPVDFFSAWLVAQSQIHQRVGELGLPGLLASFGVSMVERAVLDALCRAARLSFFAAVRQNLVAVRAGEVHHELNGLTPGEWLPDSPTESIFVRHTVGLGDPLTTAEIPPAERLDDGFPQALEDYITRTGTCYFKIKVSNQLDADIDRLTRIARLVERHLGDGYRVTLDGNEQYTSAADFDELIRKLEATPELAILWQNVLAVEQPLARQIALDQGHTEGVRELALRKPVIIDESDGSLDAYAQALSLGYRGVSSKNCKGAIRSILNAGLTWLRNGRGSNDDFIMTGEDLCCVGVIPVQADLCLAAALGLEHVERNGHHYHPGLSYLPEHQQQAALAAHPDLYARQHDRVAPIVRDGKLQIRSLQCPGFGFEVVPDFETMQSVDQWEFASLGLD